jgi:hypothetical protein
MKNIPKEKLVQGLKILYKLWKTVERTVRRKIESIRGTLV